MDTHIFPIKYPHHPLLQISYNKIHTVQILFTPPFPQQHYPYQKSKRYFTLPDAESPPKNLSLLKPPYLSCIPLTSGHEPYPTSLLYSSPTYFHCSSLSSENTKPSSHSRSGSISSATYFYAIFSGVSFKKHTHTHTHKEQTIDKCIRLLQKQHPPR